jgi:acyl-CoA thioesterase-1
VLDGHRVVVVGPPSAPSRAAAVPRVDTLLAGLAAKHDAAYVSTAGWSLPYAEDRLHLTPAGHRLFGDQVAAAIADLTA